jgi:hypothetical protein
MGSAIENGLIFIALRDQPRDDECWMRVVDIGDKEYQTLFYVKYVEKNWSDQSKFHNGMARRIQRFFGRLPKCSKCNDLVETRNTCDYCKEIFCNKCRPCYISYEQCEICNIHYCYGDYTRSGYISEHTGRFCESNDRDGSKRNSCRNCGNKK